MATSRFLNLLALVFFLVVIVTAFWQIETNFNEQGIAGGDALMLNLAYGYVGIRILHSLVQVLSPKVALRFFGSTNLFVQACVLDGNGGAVSKATDKRNIFVAKRLFMRTVEQNQTNHRPFI